MIETVKSLELKIANGTRRCVCTEEYMCSTCKELFRIKVNKK